MIALVGVRKESKAQTKNKNRHQVGFDFWWGHRDSNPGPND